MLAIILEVPTSVTIDINVLKRQAKELAADIKKDEDFAGAIEKLKSQAVKTALPQGTVA
jgi:tRNA(Ser,Leu) C12 N-acetylase TAN1